MMKAFYLFSCCIFLSFYVKTQIFEGTFTQFGKAVDEENDEGIIEKGTIIIDCIENNNCSLDTTSELSIRLYTANAFQNLGNYKKALNLNLNTLEKIEIWWGKEHMYYSITLYEIAANYSSLGDYTKSLKYNLESLKITEKTLGKEHHIYAIGLDAIASDYSIFGDYTKSLEYNFQALEIIEKVLGKEHPDYASSLVQISLDYLNLGDLSKALDYSTQSLKITEKTLGKDHIKYATKLNNNALIFSKLGNPSKSLEFNFQALEITEKVLGNKHPDYATSLNNIAMDYSDMADYAKSLEYNLQALEIIEKALGKEHPDYAMSLHNIATNYLAFGDYSKALEYNIQALNIFEKAFGNEHPYYGISLNNIASNYSALGDYSKSLEFNSLALDIKLKTLGKEHPDYAMNLNNVALDYYYMGDYTKALEYNLQVLEIREKTLGKYHPYYATSLNNISSNYYSIGDYQSASKYLKESYTIYEKNYINNQFGLDIHILTTYKKKIENKFFLNANFMTINTSNAQFTGRFWLNLNGVITSNQKNLEQEILNSRDSVAITVMNELKLSKLQLHKYQELTIQEKQERGIDEATLQEKINSLERQLSQKSESFTNFNRYFYASDVCNHLNENECFIDIVRIPYYSFYSNEWVDSTHYLVFIYTAIDTLVDYLFIKDGIGLEYDGIDNYSFSKHGEYKDKLPYQFFWQPIAEKIGNTKTIYVSLGGVYNNVNLNTLYNPNSEKYLLEEKDIRLVNSARDFVLLKEKQQAPNSNNSIALIGYPNFNAETRPIQEVDLIDSTRDLAAFCIDNLTRGDFTASLLPGTKKEVELIAELFKTNHWEVKKYTEELANETNVKALHQPRVLHFATHGYFFEDIPLNIDNPNKRFMGMEQKTVFQNPMLRSGLLLAGANRTLKGEEQEGENGLLSAAEASLLNLRGTELVVLSACETGRGEVKNSEGVYGLRKAFTDAGARNLIMSLWKVDDKVTQEFMTRFYEIWLSNQTSIREAFNQTQLEIKAKYPQPYYWGAFILVGE